MRSPWQDDGSRRGRRPAPNEGSPYDFGSPDDEPDTVEPIDMLAIRADDELLDALASGRAGYGGGYDSRSDTELDTEFGGTDLGRADLGYRDDQQLLAMLHAWRSEVLAEPIAELVTVEQASEAIVSGHQARNVGPRRRLMAVAAAALVVVLGLSGVVLGASTATPGDALWGVSKTLDGERAASVEAVERVNIALASVRAALADGRVTEARAVLAAVGPELAKVTDEETKQELARRSANLAETAQAAVEGEQVRTDESGNRVAAQRENSGPPGQQRSKLTPGEPRSGGPPSDRPPSGDPQSGNPPPDAPGSDGTGGGDTPGQGSPSGPEQGPPPGQMDTRRAPNPAEQSTEPAPQLPAPESDPPPETQSPPTPDKPTSSPEPAPDESEGGGDGEGDGEDQGKDEPEG